MRRTHPALLSLIVLACAAGAGHGERRGGRASAARRGGAAVPRHELAPDPAPASRSIRPRRSRSPRPRRKIAGHPPRPPPTADRGLVWVRRSLRDLLLLPRQGDRRSDRRPAGPARSDVHRTADDRVLRARAVRADLRLAVGARGVHRDVPAAAAAARGALVASTASTSRWCSGSASSYALFDTTHLEPGVWAFYPVLIYLLVRMVIRGFRARPLGGRLDCRLPTVVLAHRAAGARRRADRDHAAPVRGHRRRYRVRARRVQDPARAEHLLHLARPR